VRRWVRYALQAVGVTGFALLAGWMLLEGPGWNGVILAVLVALPLQLVVFGLLVVQRTGSMGFLAVWVGSTLLRMLAIGLVAWIVVRRDDTDPLAALLTLAILLFVLLLLELRELRVTGAGLKQGN